MKKSDTINAAWIGFAALIIAAFIGAVALILANYNSKIKTIEISPSDQSTIYQAERDIIFNMPSMTLLIYYHFKKIATTWYV